MKFKILSLAAVAMLALVGSAQAVNSISFNIDERYSAPEQPATPSLLVINEVYGGGGNAGAPLNQDFVELFNAGQTALDLGGFSLQYASATGAVTTFATFAAGTTIRAGSYFLVSAGPTYMVGAALPTPDFAGATGTNISATNGKVQLLNSSAAVVDLIGYGTATLFEGTGPAPSASNTTSLNRTGGVDTDQNNLDFTALAPTPVAAVPEPATYMLFGLGLLACAQRFRKKASHS